MFCTNCGNKIESEEKFCTNCGQPFSDDKKISIKTNKNTKSFKDLIHLLWNKKDLIKKWLKNIVLFFCLYFLFLAIFDAIRNSYYDDNTFIALAPTILIIFLWGKISKRFNL